MEIIFQQSLEAYSYLEQKNIVHNNVSPQNILIGFDHKIKL